MTAPAGRPARGRRLRSWPQWCGALLAAAATLTALSLPGVARAATTPGYDQMTGVGPTASAQTVSWKKGLLDNTNTPIDSANADRSASPATSPYSFMYKDFQSLKVTVSQTQDIGHQGITVSWTGGQPTVGSPIQENFLQMMECWGDAKTGPTPEQCEYGSAGLLPGATTGNVPNARIGERLSSLCAAGTAGPSLTSPPQSKTGAGPSDGCDPQEPSDPTHAAPCPGRDCDAYDATIPFSPVSDPSAAGLDYAGSTDTTYYSQANTNEVQLAVTNADGTGQQQFETLTGVQAPGLGCGQAEADNSPRGCWLVIVPRGTYEPNGYQIIPNTSNSFINSSPLSASNWAQRIQIHLGFAPVGSFCQPGTLERQTFGTQLAARAMQSWQLKLNQDAKCAKVYGYSAVFEATSTQNLTQGGDSGLAFTTIPIGSEAARDGNPAPANLPTILYAPVAITALDFGFNINFLTGYVSTPVKLTPLLLAKALTQSYRTDLPDTYLGTLAGPTWSRGNPTNISEDPTFRQLNPEVPADPTGGSLAPLLTEDHTGPNQQIWQWVQGSTAATAWLGGAPDASDQNMAVDPDYQALHLGQPPAIDSFPRAYKGELQLCEPSTSTSFPPCTASQKAETKTSIDLLPYTDNYDSAAAAVLTGSANATAAWDAIATAPDGSTGWWHKNPPEAIGQRFIWAADDTTDLAAYGLIPAQLCNDAGTSCVSPSVDAVTTAVSAAKPDSSGLLHVDPANPGTNGYPLTQIIYAAVPTNQSAAALSDYADLISYAAGSGQTAGTAPGDLPPGYLPLPSSLQAQAQAVVTQLRGLASPSPSPSPSSSGSSSAASSPAGQSPTTAATTGSGTTAGGSNAAAGAGAAAGGATPTTPAQAPVTTPASFSVPTPASTLGKLPVTGSSHQAATPGPVISLPPAQQAAGTTPRQAVGPVRWALIVVAIGGAAFAGGGAWLRSEGMPPWLRRRKLE